MTRITEPEIEDFATEPEKQGRHHLCDHDNVLTEKDGGVGGI